MASEMATIGEVRRTQELRKKWVKMVMVLLVMDLFPMKVEWAKKKKKKKIKSKRMTKKKSDQQPWKREL